ncbi:histidine phosphatase family protein [Nocardia aurantia]|uniref:Phosphoglycerate mutase GpmB n=1 Tax=Nocardia aurantia TaxID=2585199 RepID=A0A7K0DQN3_9NOCA|nr:histidine phosphatase family protein [Nocardia aurantia]MQY27898.1 phosphoglycerate mutase GpmB [Nocardia aurantia]
MTVILLRHGVSTSNVAGTLAGRSPGVDLTERGRDQAQAVADRLAALPIEHIVHSPLQRCVQTVAPLAGKLGLEAEPEERLLEVDYGQWSGRPIRELLSEPLWRVVQQHASGAVFPGGEGLAAVQFRSVAAVRELDRRFAGEAGRDVLWVACTHGDVIKSILADAFAVHLDGFQRFAVEPASISVVRYAPTGPSVWRVNDTGTDLSALAAKPEQHSGQAAAPIPGGEIPTGDAASESGPDTDNGNADRPDSPS